MQEWDGLTSSARECWASQTDAGTPVVVEVDEIRVVLVAVQAVGARMSPSLSHLLGELEESPAKCSVFALGEIAVTPDADSKVRVDSIEETAHDSDPMDLLGKHAFQCGDVCGLIEVVDDLLEDLA